MDYLRKLRAATMAAAVVVLGMGTAQAAPVGFNFTTKTWSNSLNGGTGSDLSGIQGNGFTFGGVDVFLSGGFFHDGASGAGVGVAVYSLGQTTYGPSSEPSAFTGSAVFSNNGYQAEVTTSISGGNIGFKTADGNCGYVIFDWDYPSRTMTFLSGAYESVANVAITTPSAVPLPAALPMLLAGLGGLALFRRRR